MAHIIVEGPDGSGKTTLVKALAEHNKAICAHHPGASVLGQRLRKLIKDPDEGLLIDPRTEQILMLADYSQFIAETLDVARDLEDVYSDRCNAISAYVYGIPNGASVKFLDSLWASLEFPKAEALFVLTCPFEVCLERRQNKGREKCKIEDRGLEFLRKVNRGYWEIANEPNSILRKVAERHAQVIFVLDASLSAKELFELALDRLGSLPCFSGGSSRS